MSHKTVAEVVIETLQSAGVRHCWGVPGDTLNYVTDAIRRSKIEWVHVRHEEVAGFAAGAEALLSENLTACAGSCGPGSLHFINGLFESHRNRAPVVLIASQITNDEQASTFRRKWTSRRSTERAVFSAARSARLSKQGARRRWRRRPPSQSAAWRC